MNEMPKPTTHISDIFKHISHYRLKGHQIGRKVGDMLEILTMAALQEDRDIRSRLLIEPQIPGFSGADHRIEFAVRSEELERYETAGPPSVENLLAFIECKKVGVEQTINGSFKKRFGSGIVPYGTPVTVSVNPRWAQRKNHFTLIFTEPPRSNVVISGNNGIFFEEKLKSESRFIFGISTNEHPFFLDDNRSLRSIDQNIGACKILEVKSYSREGVEAILNDCLPGPQTPEKAKQASFVAMDLRKERFGMFDKRDGESDFLSILVTTEISHWEEKSLNMIRACMDHNLVIEDRIVVHAFEVFERIFMENFLDYMTKSKITDKRTSDLLHEILEKFNHRIFTDLNTGESKSIRFNNGKIIVS